MLEDNPFFTMRTKGVGVISSDLAKDVGVSGPLLGGFVLAAGLSVDSIFYILTGLAVVGVVLTLLVPRAHVADDTTPAERAVPAGTAAGSTTR
jgi:AAHS family benzoate transporter-like MFS transporter